MPVTIEAKKKSCVEALANTEFARYTIFRMRLRGIPRRDGRPLLRLFTKTDNHQFSDAR